MEFAALAGKYNNFYAPNYHVLIEGKDILREHFIEITRVSFEDTLEGADKFTFSINDPGIEWLDRDFFEPGKEVEIKMGYVDRLTTMILGEITSLSPNFPTDGTPQLEISGYDFSYQFTRGRGQRSFENVRDSDIVASIADKAKRKLETRIDRTETTYPHVVHDRRTDYDFIRKLAKRNFFEFFVREKTLYFRESNRKVREIVTLRYGASLLSFNPVLNTANQPTEVTRRGWNVQTREEIVGRARRGSEEARERGRRSGGDMIEDQYGTVEERISDRPVSTQQEADTNARSTLNQMAEGLISGSAECIGIPEIRAGENIRLEGLGKKFSRKYYVDRSTHAISSAGYSTNFNVKENTI
jgi:phage protein D